MKTTRLAFTVILGFWLLGVGNTSADDRPDPRTASEKADTGVKQDNRGGPKASASGRTEEVPANQIRGGEKPLEVRGPANYEARTRAALKKVLPKPAPSENKPAALRAGAPRETPNSAGSRKIGPVTPPNVRQTGQSTAAAKLHPTERAQEGSHPASNQRLMPVAVGGPSLNVRNRGANPAIVGGSMQASVQHIAGLSGTGMKRRP